MHDRDGWRRYTWTGSAGSPTGDHSATIPGARQVAAPFGANTGGTNPRYPTPPKQHARGAPTSYIDAAMWGLPFRYWAYNDECEFDSWLSVGKVDGSSGLGNIGTQRTAAPGGACCPLTL